MRPQDDPIPQDTLIHEKNFYHYTKEMSFDPREIAFVMVDLWNTGFGPRPLSRLGWEAEYNAGKSFCDRVGQIEMTKILPTLKACRERGIAVAHAPTRDIAVKHRQWEALATEDERHPPRPSAPTPPDWPPQDWVKAWQQEHQYLFRTQEWITNYYEHVRPNQDIPAPLQPVDGDLVISSGAMMHRLMRERGIRVLFYCGFATNMCLIDMGSVERYTSLFHSPYSHTFSPLRPPAPPVAPMRSRPTPLCSAVKFFHRRTPWTPPA